MSQVERGKPAKVEGGKPANALSANPDRVNGKERLRLVTTFWEIYNENVIDRKVLCDHIYGILLALMQNPVLMESPGDRFSVDREGRVRFTINLSSNKPNPTLARFPVETNADFKANLQLRTNLENLESEEQQPVAELDRCDSVVQKILEILHTAESFPDHSPVKELVLQVFNDLNTRLQSLQWELQQKLPENQNQVVEKAKLAKEIGDWLLKQIEQGNST